MVFEVSMIIKLKAYRRFQASYKVSKHIEPSYALSFLNYFNLRSQELGAIRLDLPTLRGLPNREAKKRIEFQLIDWNKEIKY
jgi:cytolysin (calcineurin-like family phosphatase)